MTEFISKFAALFDDTDIAAFSPDTKFRDLEEWSSLTALSVIALADEDYGVKLKGDDIRGAQTIADLYHAIESKK